MRLFVIIAAIAVIVSSKSIKTSASATGEVDPEISAQNAEAEAAIDTQLDGNLKDAAKMIFAGLKSGKHLTEIQEEVDKIMPKDQQSQLFSKLDGIRDQIAQKFSPIKKALTSLDVDDVKEKVKTQVENIKEKVSDAKEEISNKLANIQVPSGSAAASGSVAAGLPNFQTMIQKLPQIQPFHL